MRLRRKEAVGRTGCNLSLGWFVSERCAPSESFAISRKGQVQQGPSLPGQ